MLTVPDTILIAVKRHIEKSLVHKTVSTQQLNLIYSSQSLLLWDVCLTMKYLSPTLTDMALMKQQLKEASEDETKTQKQQMAEMW
jgi:hypothetical protein